MRLPAPGPKGLMRVPHDLVQAFCFQLEGQWFLVKGIDAETLAQEGEGAFSPVYVRYAFRRLGTHQPFFPFIAADDRGKLYRDLDVIDWLISYGLLYPRADAEGLLYTGQSDQLFIKELDLGVPLQVFASPAPDAFPGQLITAAIEIVADVPFALAPGGNYLIRLASAIPVLQLNAAVPLARAVPLIPHLAADPHLVEMDSLNS